jgi:hypothetical protein
MSQVHHMLPLVLYRWTFARTSTRRALSRSNDMMAENIELFVLINELFYINNAV